MLHCAAGGCRCCWGAAVGQPRGFPRAGRGVRVGARVPATDAGESDGAGLGAWSAMRTWECRRCRSPDAMSRLDVRVLGVVFFCLSACLVFPQTRCVQICCPPSCVKKYIFFRNYYIWFCTIMSIKIFGNTYIMHIHGLRAQRGYNSPLTKRETESSKEGKDEQDLACHVQAMRISWSR